MSEGSTNARDDRYDNPKHDWTEPVILLEQDIDGSRLRVYDVGLPDETALAATRLDPDGFVVEITVTDAGPELSVAELRDLVADPDLRF